MRKNQHKDRTIEAVREFQESLRRQAANCRKPGWLAIKRATKELNK